MVRVHDIMSVDVVSVSPEASLKEAARILAEERVTGLPVVASGRVVGVVSASDILEFASDAPGVPAGRAEAEWPEPEAWEQGNAPLSAYFVDYWENAGADVLERIEEPEGPEWDALAEQTVGDVMSRTVLSVPPGVEAREAARIMLEADVHRILVMEDSRLVGVVTTTDLVKAVSQHGLAG